MPQKLAVCGSLVKPLAPGLRQIDLPDRGGPPLGTVSKLEAGIHRPDTATLEAYLDALGVDVHALAAALDQARGKNTLKKDLTFF